MTKHYHISWFYLCLAIVAFTVWVCIVIFQFNPAYGDYGYVKAVPSAQYGGTDAHGNDLQVVNSTQVCIFKPYDSFIDQDLPGIIGKVVQASNMTYKIKSVSEQVSNNNLECQHIIKIDRAINDNDRYTDKTTKYVIIGNTATIFTYKTSQPLDPARVPATAMLNWNCELQAHASKYFDNYHISNEGYYQTYQGYCNPYYLKDPQKVGELPYYVIQNSVSQVLTKWGIVH